MIKTKSENRIKQSEEFKAINTNLEFYKQKRKIKSVTLNKEKRFAEFKKNDEYRKKRNELIKKIKSQKAKSGIKIDLYLKETLKIASDFKELAAKK